jgi:hypothetical protein
MPGRVSTRIVLRLVRRQPGAEADWERDRGVEVAHRDVRAPSLRIAGTGRPHWRAYPASVWKRQAGPAAGRGLFDPVLAE